ncbi:MAG: hypothetical protein FWE91_08375 [Defluviitaleaceae bacterium]|nr:hypothetical protein [Defluviitaleaceae bacterium]MCL2835297.1 hypothetical protein [Defluviitaleaceae bacterium]
MKLLDLLPTSSEEALPFIREQQSRIKSAKIALKAVHDYVHGASDSDI